ncbi:hypothetical protein BJ944DRAFT_238379 [Cunninghamella echinulata]|nr:hypothetical protein BJ944DRAFT_238379 [Cunninghamella echinulata]
MAANSAFIWQLGEQAFTCQEKLKKSNSKEKDTILSPPLPAATPLTSSSPPPSPIPSSTKIPTVINNIEKETKYGKFMGKILLQNKSGEKKVVNQSSLTTTTYPSYLRIDRRRKHETNENFDSDQVLFQGPHWIDLNSKNSGKNLISSITSSPHSLSKKFRKGSNGKWTRWDVLGSIIPQQNIEKKQLKSESVTSNNSESFKKNEHIITHHIQNKNLNSTPIKTKEMINKPTTGDACSDCYFQAMNRKCLESIELCDGCQKTWCTWPRIFFSVLQENTAQYNKKLEPFNEDDIQSIATAILTYSSSSPSPSTPLPSSENMENKVDLKNTDTSADLPLQITSNKQTFNNKSKSQTITKKRQQLQKRGAPPPTQSRNARKLTARKKSTSSQANNNEKSTATATVTETATTAAAVNKKKLIDDETTFENNKYGYSYRQIVEVLNINGHWYSATLVRIKGAKVKVSYQEWDDQDEWIIMSSKRLRVVKDDEDSNDFDDLNGNISDNSDNSQSDNDANDNDHGHKNEQESFISTPLICTQPINSKATDYVTSTLNTDPTDIFNNNEVFMTRRMARELVDEHGFRPNSFGYHYGKAVGVTYLTEIKDGKKQPLEWIGYLRQMHKNQVRVWFPSTLQSDWVAIGSRRLRILTTEEDNEYRKLGLDTEGDDQIISNKEKQQRQQKILTKEKVSTKTNKRKPILQSSINNHQEVQQQELNTTTDDNSQKKCAKKKSKNVINSDPSPLSGHKKETEEVEMEHDSNLNTETSNIIKPPIERIDNNNVNEQTQEDTTNVKNKQKKKLTGENGKKKRNSIKEPTEMNSYLTTGAFATRRAMRQLQDEHGFVPNPYGYTYNQPIEILNTRSSKQHQFFWELGRLVAMKPGKVCVRYDGWGEQYDEWIMVGSRRIRMAQQQDGKVNESNENINNVEHNGHNLDINSTIESLSLNKEQFIQQEDDNTTKNENNASLSVTNVINKKAMANDLLIVENNPEVIEESKKKKRQRVLIGPEDYQRLGMLITEVVDNKTKAQKEQKEQVEQQQGSLLPPQPELEQEDFTDSLYVEQNNNIDEEADPMIDKRIKTVKRKKSTTVKPQYNKRQRKQKRQRKNDLHDSDSDDDNLNMPNEEEIDNGGDEEDEENKENEHDEEKSNVENDANSNNDTEIDPSHGFIANVYGYDYMQHVQVLHLDKRWYEGRLISMNRNKLRVHYCGWPDLFDEYVTVGSRRLQVVENQLEVDCLESNYRERYEESFKNKKSSSLTNQEESSQFSLVNQGPSVRRLTLDNVHEEDNCINEADDSSSVTCHQCKIAIKQFRYYCTYCETSSAQETEESTEISPSFDLCLRCFDHNFPFWHQHPRSSFAVQSVINSEIGPRPIKGELVTVWEEDIVEDSNQMITNYTNLNDNDGDQSSNAFANEEQPIDITTTATTNLEASQIFGGVQTVGKGHSYKYLKQWKRRKVCSFCNDDDDTSEDLGKFIGPFVVKSVNKNGIEKKRIFWVHDSCARYTPEVFCTPEGKWYNVTLALRRGRGVRCFECKEKGATIGCFESKCNKSFHLPCAQKPVNYFKNGVIFWCPTHEAYYNKIDTYVNVFHCDGCNKKLDEESWYSCLPCATSYFSSFDLCAECYENFPQDHPHNEDNFEETSYEIIKEMEAQKATEVVRAKEELRALNARNKTKPSFIKRKRKRADGTTVVTCCYCGTADAEQWRKAYDGGVLMCVQCYNLALLVDNDGRASTSVDDDDTREENDMAPVIFNNEQKHTYVTSIDEYTHKPYLTRDALSSTKFSDTLTGPRLATYEPQPTQIFSLIFDSTYFDIPGRAPRWASHSGTDYHGTWLPQSVRRALLKYTKKDERVLSNFLGRGTDAIECFLLQRRCCGIDINPAAVTLSQRNCCFELPIGLTEAKYRPLVAQADARNLSGSLFANESFHHILSHPPYKDCVAYSTHLEGDLSRFTSVDEFKLEYAKVVKESWRVLKMGRRLTLGIGDNREHCFYIPVSFHLMRLYIDEGFELEELIIKRQRYCSAFGLGTYLCVQFDFLVFTHEFLATFRKIPREKIDRMVDYASSEHNEAVRRKHILHGVPSSAIARKSVVMGTVWIFKPTAKYSFSDLCTSRMVERFGKDDSNWEHVQLEFMGTDADLDCNEQSLDGNNSESNIEEQSTESSDEDDNSISTYEQERLKRIEENNKTLLKLGLISELSEESEDIVHYENMMNKPSLLEAPLCLMIMEHRTIQVDQISMYRKMIVQTALEATEKLDLLGMLVIGTQDIRDPMTGKLWPMTMLVLEDIERVIDRSVLKLKEMVITVPDGYSRDRKQPIHEALATYQQQDKEDNIIIDEEYIDKTSDHLPIVHAIYLIFQRLG